MSEPKATVRISQFASRRRVLICVAASFSACVQESENEEKNGAQATLGISHITFHWRVPVCGSHPVFAARAEYSTNEE